jgi:16S rRNA (cytosine1402-N4)-methyltransferase
MAGAAAIAVAPHVPVMLEEVRAALHPAADEIIVDATFGAGGYTTAILETAPCRVIALDRDPSVAPHAERVSAQFGERFRFLSGRFGELEQLLDGQKVDGLVLDIGVSSMQLDQPERGFSFRYDAPLDMRMSGEGVSAADLVNTLEQEALARILWEYGEERVSRRIAAAIIRARTEQPIATTRQLRELIHRILPPRGQPTDPATRSFQALRIAVNQELQELKDVLAASVNVLAPGGRLVVVTFHSLEDRIVKQFLREASGQRQSISRHMPDMTPANTYEAPFTLPFSKALTASAREIAANPRARSAKLRAAVRTGEASHA